MLENQFHYQLLKCFNQQKRLINQETIKINVLPGQSKVLQCLYEYGPLTPKEIGINCIIDKSTTTTLLNKMQKKNYIEKKSLNHDKRSIQIYLTDLGKEKAKQVNQICKEKNQLILKNLSLKKQQELLNLFKEINQSLERSDDDGNKK